MYIKKPKINKAFIYSSLLLIKRFVYNTEVVVKIASLLKCNQRSQIMLIEFKK